jgi:hypothetical protein
MNDTTQAKRHRVRGRAAIVPFPVKYDEEVETAAFVSRFLVDMMPRAEHVRKYCPERLPTDRRAAWGWARELRGAGAVLGGTAAA